MFEWFYVTARVYICSSTLIVRRRARMFVWLYPSCFTVGLRGKINSRVYVYFDTLPRGVCFSKLRLRGQIYNNHTKVTNSKCIRFRYSAVLDSIPVLRAASKPMQNIKRDSINNQFFIVDCYKNTTNAWGYVIIPISHSSSCE